MAWKVWMRCISSLVQILVIFFFQNYVCMALLEHKRWQHNAVLYSDQPLLTAFLDLDTSIIKNQRLGLVQVSFLKVDSEHFKLPGHTSEPKKLDFLVKLLKHYRKENGLQRAVLKVFISTLPDGLVSWESGISMLGTLLWLVVGGIVGPAALKCPLGYQKFKFLYYNLWAKQCC